MNPPRPAAPRLPSIRQRLSQALLVISTAWGLAVAGVVTLAVHHEVDDVLDDGLQESAEILYGLLRVHDQLLPATQGDAMPAPAHQERLVWQLVGAGGQVQMRSHEAPLHPLTRSTQRGMVQVKGDWQVFALPFDSTGRMLYVAQPLDARHHVQIEAALATAGAATVVGLLCALWLRRRLAAELQPVSALSSAVAAYDPLRDRNTLAPTDRAELQPMHQAVADLGTRLADRVASERAFSAHAAHALRTPLAGMVAQLALAQRELPEAIQPRLQRTRDAANRLQRVVTSLLTLFRTGSGPQCQRLALAPLLAHLPFDHLALHCTPPDATLWADADLLAAALLNLLDNAARHGATEVQLQVMTQADGQHLRLSDNGSGLPEAQRLPLQQGLDSQIYERPLGLGLMLADLVARAHGGRLRLLASDTGAVVDLGLSAAPAGG